MPLLHRQEHIRYLEKSIGLLTSSYECLDSSRPWLVYWILNAASVLNLNFSDATKANIVGFLKRYSCGFLSIVLLIGNVSCSNSIYQFQVPKSERRIWWWTWSVLTLGDHVRGSQQLDHHWNAGCVRSH